MGLFSSSNFGGLAGGLVGGIAGAFGGNPALGASIGADIGSMLGPSQERLANRQYVQQMRDSISLWNMQNEYNSPLEQRKRLVEAGYNPMLLQGADTASSISQPSYPHVQSSGRGSGISASVARFFLNKQMENAEDQNMRDELINENWRLRNLKLSKEIEKTRPILADKVRKDKPMTLSEKKYLDKQIKDYNNKVNPTDLTTVKGVNNISEALVENAVYYPLLATLDASSSWREFKSLNNIKSGKFNPYEERYGRR